MPWTCTKKSLLLFTAILVPTLLWRLFPSGVIEISVDPNNIIKVKMNYSLLDCTDTDGSPEDACSCSAIMQGDTVAVEKAKILTTMEDFKKSVQIPDEHYINATRDCREFIYTRKYQEFPFSQEEEDFPLAYSIVTHQKVQNFERLLRAIYAPQNVYCVHVDRKAAVSVHAAIMGITSCFPNVFMVSKPVKVVYASWSRVQADLNCMADLYNTNVTWKYFINLCGQDFPLKTNLEIVRSLQALNGRNSLMSETAPQFSRRWQVVYEVVDDILRGTERAKGPPPFNLPILFGSAYIVVSRGYIRSVLEDSRVHALIEWAKDAYSPDEILWATIQRMSNVPGSTRPNRKFDVTDMNAIARLVKWNDQEGSDDSLAAYPPCHGSHVREICVYGAGDLEWMIKQHHLFANKFDIDIDPIAILCLERYLRHKAETGIH